MGDLEDDIDLSLSPIQTRRSAPKQGRRAAFDDSAGSGSGMPPKPDLSFGSSLKARQKDGEEDLFLGEVLMDS